MTNGVVSEIRVEKEAGRDFFTVIITHRSGYRTVYQRLGSVSVTRGEAVMREQVIGKAFSDGPVVLRVWLTPGDKSTPRDPRPFMPGLQPGEKGPVQ